MPEWERYLVEHQEQYVSELVDFLRIPSISGLPAHAGDVRRAAAWTAQRLQAAGLNAARVVETGGHPAAYAEWLSAPGKLTVLIYGHFDTQPVDPENLWTSPPFEPEIREGRVYARGASDMKGGIMLAIAAVEALLKTAGSLPVNVKFFCEGEEEVGSPSLRDFVPAHKAMLGCDLVLNADGGQWSESEPALLEGLRGWCALQLDVQGPNSDLHSGGYGGAIQNPLHALAELLASLHTPEGKVAVAGFYDDVVHLGAEERARIAAVPFDEADYKQQIGENELFGEPGYTTYERLWVRPTLEINGMGGGFVGQGIKAVLPRAAQAKISCRLVPDQDPYRISDLVQAHLRQHTPPGVQVTVRVLQAAYPYLVPADSPGNQAASAVLTELYGREPYHVRTGGTVPVCAIFRRHLDAFTIGFGFGLHDEHAHAPDEFFRLSSMARGENAYCRLLQRLGNGL